MEILKLFDRRKKNDNKHFIDYFNDRVEQLRLFDWYVDRSLICTLLQAIFEVKENLQKDLDRELTDGELASAMNMSVSELQWHIEVGQAARNKLIKVHTLTGKFFNSYLDDMYYGFFSFFFGR